ncbi:hypothetical protein WDZ92_39750, partial [Nostoc sp. NIES-2111]
MAVTFADDRPQPPNPKPTAWRGSPREIGGMGLAAHNRQAHDYKAFCSPQSCGPECGTAIGRV